MANNSMKQLVHTSALAAAKIIVEALRRAGREVTREERLVDTMESLQRKASRVFILG